MTTPLTVRSVDNGGPIRSVTIGNQTSATTATVFLGNSAAGAPLYSVLPGNYATIPVMQSSALTIAFAYASGGQYDGSIYIHTDVQPLAASGFTQGQQNVVGLTPVLLWAASEANGTTSGYMPPVFTSGGIATAVSEHIVRGQVAIPVGATNSSVVVTVQLAGAAIFASAGSYIVLVSLTAQYYVPGWTATFLNSQNVNGSSFNVTYGSVTGAGASGASTPIVNFIAIGY